MLTIRCKCGNVCCTRILTIGVDEQANVGVVSVGEEHNQQMNVNGNHDVLASIILDKDDISAMRSMFIEDDKLARFGGKHVQLRLPGV